MSGHEQVGHQGIVVHGDGRVEKTCRTCRQRFTIAAGEQQWFADLARRNPHRPVCLPSVCWPCRQAARASGTYASPREW